MLAEQCLDKLFSVTGNDKNWKQNLTEDQFFLTINYNVVFTFFF